MRLRAHFVRDDELRQTIENDLDEMEAMIQSTLDFLRGDATGEEIKTVDIGTIIETVCDHLVDSGHDVVLRAGTHAPLSCRPLAIKRAFYNLVENAVKYGPRARVSLRRNRGSRCTIDDDGPGIPTPSSKGGSIHSIGWTPAEVAKPAEPAWDSPLRATIRAHGGDIQLAKQKRRRFTRRSVTAEDDYPLTVMQNFVARQTTSGNLQPITY